MIPTIGVYDSVDDIPFDDLPERYVIKCNHDSGSVYICQSKSTFDIEIVKNDLRKKLQRNAYWASREWQYKNIKPQIIVEELLLDDKGNPPSDIKLFCFNGEPNFCQVIRDRFANETVDIFDLEWNLLSFVGLSLGVKNGIMPVDKPHKLKEMIFICK